MKKKNKILIISGDLLKHKYVAIKILKKFSNARIVFENYPKDVSKKYTNKKSKIIKKHFNDIKIYEKKYFNSFYQKNKKFMNKRTLFSIKRGELNNSEVINNIIKYNPKLIIINATSIIKKKLIKIFYNKIINIHAGLLPYYKGTGCNVWTFFNNQLEYTGITIHFVNEKIDDGNIISQIQSKFNKFDNTHSIGCKNAILSANLINKAASYLLKNQNYKGKRIKTKNKKLYKIKDFNSKTIFKINNLIKDGLVEKYCKNKKKKIKIISL